MQILTVDLYKEYGYPRGENKGGMLTCILHGNTHEISKDRKYPAMLVLPGGGYFYCSDRESEPLGEKYYNAGFNIYILKYSCYPSQYPVQIRETALASDYIRKDKNFSGKLAAIGFSAGGHLCGHFATISDDDLEGLSVKADDVRPDAAILSYAVVAPEYGNGMSFERLCDKDPAISEKLTIDRRVDEKTPPLFIWHTADDGCVDSMQALRMGVAAKNKGVPFELHIFAEGEHGLSTCDETVYNRNYTPHMSTSAGEWLPLSISFLRDKGFVVID